MKIIRTIVGKLILWWDAIFQPRPLQRSSDAQAQIEKELHALKLYQFLACPFCVKVRREMKRLNLPIETRDAKNDTAFRNELLEKGGKIKVPCLRIEEAPGQYTWMYESNDIIAYLQQRFSNQSSQKAA